MVSGDLTTMLNEGISSERLTRLLEAYKPQIKTKTWLKRE